MIPFKEWSRSQCGEGNGSPLQCSCLENPRDGGAWWAAIYGVAQSWTRLQQLSSSLAAAKSQCLPSLGAYEKCRLLNITLDLLIQNLPFNKIPRSTEGPVQSIFIFNMNMGQVVPVMFFIVRFFFFFFF